VTLLGRLAARSPEPPTPAIAQAIRETGAHVRDFAARVLKDA
jgi:hypothetical protein